MYNKELLIEVNRIKEMMGLLLEGFIDDGTKKLLIALGYSNEYIDNLAAKSAKEIQFSQVADELAGFGIRSYDNLVSKANDAFSKKVGEILTSDEIYSFLMKTSPDFVDNMNKKIAVLASETATNILKKKSVMALISKESPKMVVELKSLLYAPLTGPSAKSIDDLNAGLNFVSLLISKYEKLGKVVPTDLTNLEKDFVSKIGEQGKQASSPRITIDPPKKMTPEELAELEDLKRLALKLAKDKQFSLDVMTAMKSFLSFPQMTNKTRKALIVQLETLIAEGRSMSDILAIGEARANQLLNSQYDMAKLAKENSTWNKTIKPALGGGLNWISNNKVTSAIIAMIGLTYTGYEFRDQFSDLIEYVWGANKELRTNRTTYEDNQRSFIDFLAVEKKLKREEQIGTKYENGIYYDKNGNGYTYVGGEDKYFKPVGTTPVVPPVVPPVVQPPGGTGTLTTAAQVQSVVRAVSAQFSNVTVASFTFLSKTGNIEKYNIVDSNGASGTLSYDITTGTATII